MKHEHFRILSTELIRSIGHSKKKLGGQSVHLINSFYKPDFHIVYFKTLNYILEQFMKLSGQFYVFYLYFYCTFLFLSRKVGKECSQKG